MKVIEISEFGGPEVLRVAERPDPRPGAGDVLIQVAAAGVNRPDVVQRYGKYPPPPGASDIPGLEVSGVVAEVGDGVERWRAGDRVCALLAGGGYAERAVAPQEQCLPIPEGLTAIEAAAVPETFFTVWTNVFERGRLQAGEWILIHGGSSGIGTTAIQLASARGARVIVTARTDEKCEACRALGADLAVNYLAADWVAEALQATDGRGVNVVLDMVGGDYTARNLKALATEGRLVQIAFLKSSTISIDLSAVMRRRLWITGSTLRPRTPAEKGAIAAAVEAHVWPLLASRRVRPLVAAVYPLARAADAHALMESSTHIGKIVLDVGA
jgi:putative PIG3 family NAD(P)H quinone oxidoreductase